MEISLTLDSLISGFTSWIRKQFEGIFAKKDEDPNKKKERDSERLPGASPPGSDLDCWPDAAAKLGADFRAADIEALATDHPAAAKLLADHGHFLHRRMQVKDPSVFFRRPGRAVQVASVKTRVERAPGGFSA